MRSSDINKLRKLRHAQAVLLGCVFDRHSNVWFEYGTVRWYATVPASTAADYIRGPYDTRHGAVDEALRLLGVELKEPDYRHGNNGAAEMPDAANV